MHDLPTDDNLYALSLALLQLIDHPIDITLLHDNQPQPLRIQGTLLRAFDTPSTTEIPTITINVHNLSITIRLGPINRITYHRTTNLKRIQLHLTNNSHLILTPIR